MLSLGYQANQQSYEIDNLNSNKNVNIVSNVIKYETITKYDSSIPKIFPRLLLKDKMGLIIIIMMAS